MAGGATGRVGTAPLLVGLALGVVVSGGCAGGQPQAQPQVRTERVGEPQPPLPAKAKVQVMERGEPDQSYREVGKVTSTCPVKQWVGGREELCRPICLKGLRQGARQLGAQAVIEVRTKTIRPEWAPNQPWLIMRGVAVTLLQ